MTTQPPPEFAHLQAHSLIGHRPDIIYHALWLPTDRLWMVGAQYRTPEKMAEMGWSYGAPISANATGTAPPSLKRESMAAAVACFRPVTDAWNRIFRTR